MEVCAFSLVRLWIVFVALLLASGRSAVGTVDVWDDEVQSLEFLDGGGFKRLVRPLVEMTANAYRYPGVIPIPGWILVDAIAPIHGGMHAVVYKDDFNAGRMVVAFRGTDISGSESSKADVCADEVLWGELPAFVQEGDCSQFSRETLDYYKHAVDYTRKVLEAHPQASFLLTGHSLGAALAILVTATLSTNQLPVVAFSAGGTKSILERMSLKLTSDNDKKLYIIADKWDEIMRKSWGEQIGTLCLYETSLTEDCKACFEDGTNISTELREDVSLRELCPHTPSIIEDVTLQRDQDTRESSEAEVNQNMPDLTGSALDCFECFLQTHYLQHVIDLVELGNKPICESRRIRNVQAA